MSDDDIYGPHPVARETPDGPRIHVIDGKCATCIFHPGNRMNLQPGRVKGMLEEALAREGHIVCHSTLPNNSYGLDPAICGGFAEHPEGRDRSLALRTGRAFGIIEKIAPPTKGSTQ